MKKEILTFIFDGYADWESAYICSQLNQEETDYAVKTISLNKDPIVSMAGFHVLPDYSIDDYPKDFKMLLLIGGEAWVNKSNNDVKPLVDYAAKNNIPIGAICGATIFMGENGYLDDKKHTSNTLEYLKQYAPDYKGDINYVERQVVTDENIITANGTAALEFAREIMIKLEVMTKDKIDQWYEFNKKGFYED